MYSAQKKEAERIRKSLLGNSYSCPVVAWLVSHLLFREGLAVRVASPDEVASGRTVQLAARQKCEPLGDNVPPPRPRAAPDLELVERLGAGVDHRGSDVRLALGEAMRPSAWPRREVPARWWRWRTVLALAWKIRGKEHINALEVRSTLAALRWRARQARLHSRRSIHLSDSFVAIGVLTKRRSSSFRLAPIIRRINSLELASDIHLYHAFTRLSNNPADDPSRLRHHSRWRKRRRPPEW